MTFTQRLRNWQVTTAREDDGPGVDKIGYALVIEATARADASMAVVMVASNLGAVILAHHATGDQRARFVQAAARGEPGALSFALTDPGAGSDAGSDAVAILTTARRNCDDWLISGAKQWITGASHA